MIATGPCSHRTEKVKGGFPPRPGFASPAKTRKFPRATPPNKPKPLCRFYFSSERALCKGTHALACIRWGNAVFRKPIHPFPSPSETVFRSPEDSLPVTPDPAPTRLIGEPEERGDEGPGGIGVLARVRADGDFLEPGDRGPGIE